MKNYPNSSKEELRALKNLTNDNSILIKAADKGNNIEISDKKDYLLEAGKQLPDENIYESITSNPLTNLNKGI